MSADQRRSVLLGECGLRPKLFQAFRPYTSKCSIPFGQPERSRSATATETFGGSLLNHDPSVSGMLSAALLFSNFQEGGIGI